MRPVLDYAAFGPLIFSDLTAALRAASGQSEEQQHWTWATVGVRSFELQLANLRYWVDFVASTLSIQVNSFNPVNKLPDEILCMIFAEVFDGPDDVNTGLVLSEVCRHWRDVVYNNKAFWATIAFNGADSGTRLAEVQWQMERSAPAPLDLDLNFPTGTSARPAEEFIREHLYHTRSLALVAHKDVLAQQRRTALTMPAPLLTRLGLMVCIPYSVSLNRELPAPFPPDLFSGAAPRLRELFLDNVSLPRLSWSPLRSLESFSLRLAVVDSFRLSLLVWVCSSLRTLRVIAQDSFEALIPGADPRHAARSHPGPIDTVIIRPALASPSDVDDFLRRIGCQDPLRFGLVVQDTVSNLFWFIEAMLDTPVRELHFSSCKDAVGGFSVATTARSADGKTRAASLAKIGGLTTFALTFVYLYELTLPEMMWPSGGFPALPNLRTLTIVLKDQRSTDPQSPSIFLLSLTRGIFWDIPSLCTLNLAYVDSGEVDCDGSSCWAKQTTYTVPLVISALEVATFLTWNLHGGHSLRLFLQNVALFEQSDSYAMHRLRGLVQVIVLEHGYLPKVLEGLSLCNP